MWDFNVNDRKLSCGCTWYDEQKEKGKFQHSSFLAGGVTTAAGRLLVNYGVLQVHNVFLKILLVITEFTEA